MSGDMYNITTVSMSFPCVFQVDSPLLEHDKASLHIYIYIYIYPYAIQRLKGIPKPQALNNHGRGQVGDIIELSRTKEIPDETFDHFLPASRYFGV